MEHTPFLTVDEQRITLNQAIGYLQTSGKFGAFIGDILRQHILEQELQALEHNIEPETIEHIIHNLRNEHQLSTPELFEQWLSQNGLSYDMLYTQLAHQIRLAHLVSKVSEPRLQHVFIEKKLFLDQVVLSRLVVEERELAEELKTQIQEEHVSFEHLVQEHSMTDDRVINGWMGAISRGQLADAVRVELDHAQEGDIVGPLNIAGRWCLFRIEQRLPASLADEHLKRTLQTEIFENWLAAKIQAKKIQLHLTAA